MQPDQTRAKSVWIWKPLWNFIRAFFTKSFKQLFFNRQYIRENKFNPFYTMLSLFSLFQSTLFPRSSQLLQGYLQPYKRDIYRPVKKMGSSKIDRFYCPNKRKSKDDHGLVRLRFLYSASNIGQGNRWSISRRYSKNVHSPYTFSSTKKLHSFEWSFSIWTRPFNASHIEQRQTFELDHISVAYRAATTIWKRCFFISNTSILHQPLFVNVISQSLQKINHLFHQSDVSIHAAGTAGTACSNSQGFVCAFPKSAESFAVK